MVDIMKKKYFPGAGAAGAAACQIVHGSAGPTKLGKEAASLGQRPQKTLVIT